MPTLMPADTAAALGPNAEKCDSRSLLLERFADPTAKEDSRKSIFTRAFNKPVNHAKSTSHAALATSLAGNETIYVQLQSRLMVNMAGGVMENAGLCLDRFGLPYIPGSAVKGCARRAALAALHEWCETGTKPTGADNPLAACCSAFPTPAEMLSAIARVFGWCEQDWSDQSNQSDFLWACGQNHREHWHTAAQALAAHFGWTIADYHRETPWESLPNFAGNISFLPAYPVDLGKTGKVDGLPLEVPPLGKLELDVVTCHHSIYYSPEPDRQRIPEKWREWQAHRSAPDTEEPNPVVFPAVAPGHVFAFAIAPLRGGDPKLVQHARTWLATGLSVFGLGAKTAAGYGWFDCSATIHNTVQKTLHDRAERERAEKQSLAEEQRRKAEEAERLRQKQEREAALANLSGDERADKEIELLTDPQFDAKVRAFCKEPKKGGPTEEQKKAIVRALRSPRLAYWQAFRKKATKGELATVDQAIRQLSKAMNLGKMP